MQRLHGQLAPRSCGNGTNGRAERFIKTLQIEWAYAASYQNHHQRAATLAPWLEYYNCRRPHSALGHKPPARITQAA